MNAKIRQVIAMGLAFVSLSAWLIAQAPARDIRKEVSGTAMIAGVVQTNDESHHALKRAMVKLSGDALLTPRLVITDADGSFVFAGLPAGSYSLSATCSGFASMTYGAKRTGGAGAALVVRDGERAAGLTLRLPPYAVITGTIYDQNGEPAPHVSVEFLHYTLRTGERMLSTAYGQPATTDDRGIYRQSGLEPGDYFVAAGISPDVRPPGDVVQLAELDVDRILAGDRSLSSVATSSPQTPRAFVGYAPVFFPGSADIAGASTITLKSGEERSGIDIKLQLVPAAMISGTVIGIDGQPIVGAQISATRQTDVWSLDLFGDLVVGNRRSDTQGRFAYGRVPPGSYAVTARVSPPGVGDAPMWASADVNVNGADENISLTLAPAMAINGKVMFDGVAVRPADLTSLRVSLPSTRAPVGLGSGGPRTVAPRADGTFTIGGLAPGRFTLTASMSGASPWILRSAIVNGVDALDSPFDVKPNQDISNAVITFTDHPTELSGVLQVNGGVPTSDYFLIVFSVDKTFWMPRSRRIVMARPATSGEYTIKNLPPGDYRIAAVPDVEPNQWFDPAFLATLVPDSIAFSLAEGEKKTQSFKIGG